MSNLTVGSDPSTGCCFACRLLQKRLWVQRVDGIFSAQLGLDVKQRHSIHGHHVEFVVEVLDVGLS